MWLLNSPRADYKLGASKRKKQNIHTQKTNQGNLYYLSNNNESITAIMLIIMLWEKNYIHTYILNAIYILTNKKISLYYTIKKSHFVPNSII
jgi:hypothetical protein